MRCSFFLIIVSLLLTGCGFKLRGQEPLPPQLRTLYLETKAPYSPLTKQLRQILPASGITLVSTRSQAPLALEIINDSQSQQVTGISTTQVMQYSLTYTLIYQIRDSKGRVLFNPHTIKATRTFTANFNQMLGGSLEQNLLYNDMRQDIISQLLNQLSSRNTAKAVTQSP